MSEENKVLAEYESTLEASQKNFDLFNDHDYSSGLWDAETKAMMDIWTLKNIYFTEDWAYILVDRIASKIAAIPLQVVKETVIDGDIVREPALNHPFQKRIDCPNEHESYYQWMYSIVADHEVTGNAIIWDAPLTQQLVKIPTELVQMYFDPRSRQLESYFVYRSSLEDMAIVNDKTIFSKDEIIHVRRPNPSSIYWGLSPFLPGKKSILFNRYTSEYLNNFYIKGAQPGMVFTLQDETNEKVALRMLRSLELAHTGRKNQRRNMIVPKGVNFSTAEHKIADQNLKEHIMYNRETIINLLQVPKHELSINEGTRSLGSSDEYKTALKNFWNGPLKSIMQSIEWSLWTHFKDQLGEGFSLQFDVQDIEALRDDDDKKADLANKMLSTHTLNEVRSLMYDLGPLPDGDKTPGVVPTPSYPPAASAPAAEAPKTLEAAPPKDEEVKTVHFMNVQKLDQLKTDQSQWWKRRSDMAGNEVAAKEPKMVELVMNLFGKQAIAAVKAVKSFTVEKAADVPSKARLLKAVRDALSSFESYWLDNFTEALMATVEVGYDTALELPFNLPNQSEIQATRIRNENGRLSTLEERGLDTFANMSQTTTEKIIREVTEGLTNNLTVQDIAKNIAQVMTDEEFTIGRATTIARTEVLTASSIGEAAAMNDAAEVVPQLKKVWLNAGDNRVRGGPGDKSKGGADHWSINGEMVDYDAPFSNGLFYPRDLDGEARETINCRCTWLMVPGDEAGNMGLQNIPDLSGTERE